MVSPHPSGSITPTPPQVCSYDISILFMNTLVIKAIPLADHENKSVYEMGFFIKFSQHYARNNF